MCVCVLIDSHLKHGHDCSECVYLLERTHSPTHASVCLVKASEHLCLMYTFSGQPRRKWYVRLHGSRACAGHSPLGSVQCNNYWVFGQLSNV